MATLPLPEQCARNILSVFEYFNCRPGEGLQLGNLTIRLFSDPYNMRSSDIEKGLTYGGDRDWFENGPNGFILITEIGFAEIGMKSDHQKQDEQQGTVD